MNRNVVDACRSSNALRNIVAPVINSDDVRFLNLLDITHCLPVESIGSRTQQLTQIFNFSPAEARLARALAHGLELEGFAIEQGVKMTTIRSQMASVYNKARVKRQTELTRVIMSIPCARQPNEP